MIIFSSIGGLTLLSFLLLPPRSNAFVSRGNSVLPHIKANRIVDTTVIGGEKPSTGRLFGKWENYDHSDHDGSSYEDALARNKARTDVRNFLTQRAIQSFIFLLDQCRDPHTIAWVEVSFVVKKGSSSFLRNENSEKAPLQYATRGNSCTKSMSDTKVALHPILPHHRMPWIVRTLGVFMVQVHST